MTSPPPTTTATTTTTAPIRVTRVNYRDADHARMLVEMLDAYAQDPAGGSEGLSDFAKANLAAELAKRPQAFSVLAFAGEQPIGLVNCIEGFSSFACRPLVNIHDVAVVPGYRGQRVAEKMLALVEEIARERGACKLTLEVLQGNAPALKLYERVGFAGYQLDPAMGNAVFYQKALDAKTSSAQA